MMNTPVIVYFQYRSDCVENANNALRKIEQYFRDTYDMFKQDVKPLKRITDGTDSHVEVFFGTFNNLNEFNFIRYIQSNVTSEGIIQVMIHRHNDPFGFQNVYTGKNQINKE